MNKREFAARCEYFDLVHGVTVRAIAAFSDEELDYRPRPGMRTVRELVFHIYGQERVLAAAARQAQFTVEMANRSSPEHESMAATLRGLLTVADAVAFAKACHDEAADIFRSLSEEDLARIVASPFGPYPAWRYFVFAYDEHWHHRGQLYTYLRLVGKEPPMLYDYSVAGQPATTAGQPG